MAAGPSEGVRLCVMLPRVDGSGKRRPVARPGRGDHGCRLALPLDLLLSAKLGRRPSDAEYVLDSTLQCSGKRMRIIVRLLDLHAGSNVIWARRFDRELDDALMLQDELAAEMAAQIDPELLLREGERRSPASRRSKLRRSTSRCVPFRQSTGLSPSGFHAAGELLAAAAAMDPGNASAHAWWAYWHLFLVGQAWSEDPVGATLRAGELAERAVTLDPGDARALTLVGHVRGFLHKRPRRRVRCMSVHSR